MLRLLAAAALVWATPARAQWVPVYDAGPDRQVAALASDGDRLFAATWLYPSGADVVASTDGADWTSLAAPFPAFGYRVDVVYSDGQTILAGYSGAQVGGVLRSDDRGASWRTWNDGFGTDGNYVYDLDVASGLVYAATIQGVYRARLGDATWTFTSAQIPQSAYGVTAIARKGDTVVAGSFGDPLFGATGGLFRSRDGGASWAFVTAAFSQTDQLFDIERTDAGFVAIGTANGQTGPTPSQTYASPDGETWMPVEALASAGIPAGVVAYQDGAFAFINVPGEAGVLYSADALTGWQPVDAGLPANAVVQSLAVHKGFLYAALFQPTRSVWRRPLEGVVAAEPPPVGTSFALGAPRPNPAVGATRVPVMLAEATLVRVNVVATDGRIVRFVEALLGSGPSELSVDLAALPAGVYALRVRAGGAERTAAVTVVR